MYELCKRTKNGGGKCEAPALKGKSFCYYHDPRKQRRARAVKVRYFLELATLETEGAVRAAISETVQALVRKEIGTKFGGKLLYALQLASSGKLVGNQQGRSAVKQSSPRFIKIARTPGFTKIYCTSRQPNPGTPESPRPLQLPAQLTGRLPAVNAVAAPVTRENAGVYL